MYNCQALHFLYASKNDIKKYVFKISVKNFDGQVSQNNHYLGYFTIHCNHKESQQEFQLLSENSIQISLSTKSNLKCYYTPLWTMLQNAWPVKDTQTVNNIDKLELERI